MDRSSLHSRRPSGDTSAMLERRSLRVAVVWGLAGGLTGGCLQDYDLPHNTGSLGGQVVLSSGVRGARVVVDQLNAHTGHIYQRVGEATSDEHGRFLIAETREANGLFHLVARGGSFEDLATGATIQLDDTDELHSLLWFPIVDRRQDALVSPVGHLAWARAWSRFEALGDLTAAVEEATRSLHRHFGQAEWGLLKLHDLGQPATSPTAPVRAAFVHAALSYLVKDIAAAAGASPQQVNVYTLVQRWTADLVRAHPDDLAVFDGNDRNDRAFGSGLQLGLCDPVEAGCVAPSTGCNTGHCRPECDLYVGTPRSMLAGAMTKVIRDTGEDGVNQTGLRIEDMLAVARAVSDNVDPDLFGAACVEDLDRTRPEVRWEESATPAADAVVRGVVPVKAIGLDDVDLRPRTEIVGYADLDGNPSDNVAIANIDTAGIGDGGLTVSASAVDLAGNSSTIERRLIVDNTPPQLTLSPAGFFADGSTWWTMSPAPTLTGTVLDAYPAAVQATIGAMQVPGTITGGSWSVALPASTIDLAGANVTIRVTDRAGNHAELTQRLRYDGSSPILDVQPSTAHDEASEAPAFSTDESPIHSHNGMPIDLAVSGSCPTVTKYSYLLGSASPPHVTETPSRNPIAYRLVSADDGVGIVDGSTQYRVLRREASGSTVVLDWTSAGPGTPIATTARLFDVALVSDLVSGLDTTEAIYDVELRATDRLSRTSTTARCFELRLRAPPLHFLAGGPATWHTFALGYPGAPTSLSLAPGAPFDPVAARLLNDNATGASLLDQPVINGTTETVFLTVTVTKPSSVSASQKFEIRNFTKISTVTIDCGPPEDPNPACDPVASFPPGGGYASPLITPPATTNLMFPVKLYELDGAGIPTTEIPCLAPCSVSGSVFKFAVPPRAVGGPARRFIVMTMIGQVRNLWPTDANQNATQPFADLSVNGVRYTGRSQFFSSGCGLYGPGMATCKERWQKTQYRALTYAKLDFASDTRTTYATAATAQLAPAPATNLNRAQGHFWETFEGALP